jgi:hypothetical protein
LVDSAELFFFLKITHDNLSGKRCKRWFGDSTTVEGGHMHA